MPVEFRSPTGLWLLGLLVPLVVLYVLKIRRQRLRIPSTWLWQSAERDLVARQPFRRLVVQLPLILQLLALTLLALALARPAARASVIEQSHVALVIDTSASMAARTADGSTRIAEARTAAKRILRSLAPGSDVLVIEAGREPRVAAPVDRDTRRLEAVLDRIDARDVEGSLSRALGLASDRLRQLSGSGTSEKRVFAITDGALADPAPLGASLLPLSVIRVGTPVENTAIVRLDVRTGTDPRSKREQVQVFSLVAHYGSKPREVFVTLRQRNVSEPLASRRLLLGPGERAPVVLTFEPARNDAGTGLVVELSPGDALAVDDRAYARVPQGRTLPVVMAPSDGNPWVKRALLADPDVELLGTPLAGLSTAAVPEDALLVVDGACPMNPPGGDLLILNPPAGPCHSLVVGKPIENLSVTSWAESDPRFRFLILDGVDILKARRIETTSPAETLARAREGTLISDLSSPERTGTLLGFDVGDSNWPLKASFVLFIRNVLELARTHRAHTAVEGARTGEAVRLRVPSDVSQVSVETPSGSTSTVLCRNSLAILPDTARAGFYHVSWQGARPGSVLLSVNLVSEAESDLRPRELVEEAHGAASSAPRGAFDAWSDFTWLFAALALGFVIIDVVWLTRRRRPSQKLDALRPLLPDRAARRSP